jgi:hypothetical protein
MGAKIVQEFRFISSASEGPGRVTNVLTSNHHAKKTHGRENSGALIIAGDVPIYYLWKKVQQL